MFAVGKKERQIPMRIRKLRKSGKKENKKSHERRKKDDT